MRVVLWAAILPLLYLWSGGPKGIANAALAAGGYDVGLRQAYADAVAQSRAAYFSGGLDEGANLPVTSPKTGPDWGGVVMLALAGVVVGATVSLVPQPWGAKSDSKPPEPQGGDSKDS